MTSDRIIVRELKQTLEDLAPILAGFVSATNRIHRITDSIDAEEEIRTALCFKFDLEDAIENPEENDIVRKVRRFREEHDPAGFDLSARSRFSFARLSRQLQQHCGMGPEISMKVLDIVTGFAFQLGFIKGWEAKKSKQRKPSDNLQRCSFK